MENKQQKLQKYMEYVQKKVEQDKEKIIQFCASLVQCKTSSKSGDTRSAMLLIKNFLQQEGIDFKEVYSNKIMPNVISTIDTKQVGRHLMFNGHLDVMPAGKEPDWQDSPWSGKITEDRIWGRGTQDMKAGVTAMLFAYSYLAKLKENFHGKLSITLVSDEETGYGRGTGFLLKKLKDEMLVDCVLAAEPSGIDSISISSKGYIQFTIEVQTHGAIAGYSYQSESAIAIAAAIIQDLKALQNITMKLPSVLEEYIQNNKMKSIYENRRGREEVELLNKVTVDITTIRGGDLLVTIAPKCKFTVAMVIPVGIDIEYILEKVQNILKKYPQAKLLLDGVDVDGISPPNHAIVKILQKIVPMLGYKKPEPIPDIAISDCRYWRKYNIPAFWYGVDGGLCSAANEYVKIEELLHLVRTYTLVGLEYLNNV